MVKLPFWRTVGRAYAFNFGHLGLLARLAWFWLLAAYAVVAVVQTQIYRGASAAWLLLTALAWVAIGAIIAVAWQRSVLLDEKPRYMAPLSGRSMRYMGRMMVLGLMVGVPVTVAVMGSFALIRDPRGSIVPEIAIPITAVVVTWLVANRLGLALTAAAVDDNETGFGRSWRLTRGNSWRLFWGMFLTMLPFSATGRVFELLRARAGELWLAIAFDFAATAMMFLQVAAAAGFLAFAYEHFVGRPSPTLLWQRGQRVWQPV